MRKIHQHLRAAKEAAVERSLPVVSLAKRQAPSRMLAHEVDVEEELDEAARAVKEDVKARYLRAEDLQQYAIQGNDFSELGGASLASGSIVQVLAPGDGKASGGTELYKKDKSSGKQKKEHRDFKGKDKKDKGNFKASKKIKN